MVVLVRVFAALLLTLAAPAAVAAQVDDPLPPIDGELATVVEVIDGDTIRVERANGDVERVRYIGMDTPELASEDAPAEPFGPRAAAANAGFVADQVVLLETDVSDRDRYDRLLRYVWVETEDGTVMVNERLVALGLATVKAYEPDTRHHQYLLESQEQARLTGRGMHEEEAVAGALVGAEVMAYLFYDAYDARDGATLRQLMDGEVTYILPDDTTFSGKRNVMARFREEWSELDPALEIRGSIAQPDAAMLELTISYSGGEDPGTFDAVAVQRWPGERLAEYRLYRDR